MVDTVTVTGRIRLPDNSIPVNADAVFTISGSMSSSNDVAVPHSVTTPVGSDGSISVNVTPTVGAFQHYRYSVTVIEYQSADKQVEAHRHDLGKFKISESVNIATLLPIKVSTKPFAPMVYRRGDTIALGLQSLDDNGAKQDLTGVTITSAMKHTKTGEVTPLVVDNVIPLEGLYRIYLSDTSTLDLGNYMWNISFTANGEKTSTELRELRIESALA